ncbi:hypothetical protein AKJ16_DCAP14495 [Drosera capensis]
MISDHHASPIGLHRRSWCQRLVVAEGSEVAQRLFDETPQIKKFASCLLDACVLLLSDTSCKYSQSAIRDIVLALPLLLLKQHPKNIYF